VLEHYRKLNLTFFTPFYREEYGGIYRGVKSVPWSKVGLGGPLVRPASYGGRAAKFPGRAEFEHWMPCAPTFLDTLAKWSLKRRQHLAGRPHFGSVGPEFCATSSPHIIFSVTIHYF
jgi:hypothetical protein